MRLQMRNLLGLLVFILVLENVDAQLKLPTFFADYMVLQQNSSNAIWGWAKPNTKVTVLASWDEKSIVKSDDEGNWKAFIKTPSHCINQTIIISSSKEELMIMQVAVGEVWLCLGQSNMGWSLRNCFNGEKDAAIADNSLLRIYKSDRQHWHEPKEDCTTGKWYVSSPPSARETSAVAYYFGSTLQKQLDVPVGIIVQAYAGTPVEGWMPWSVQKDNARSIRHKDELDKTSKRQNEILDITDEKAKQNFVDELELYNQKMVQGDTMKNSVKRLMRPIITKPANLGNQYPAHIFNAMVNPLVGYGIKGAIWYQGERNSKTVQQAVDFKVQLQLMIRYYRDEWNKASNGNVADDFYFSLTQLPSWGILQSSPVEDLIAPWAVSRNVMFELAKEDNNIGLAVSIDTGSPILLHPKNKRPIGKRHAFGIINKVYQQSDIGHGPFYKSHEIKNNSIVLSFDGVGSGLMTAREGQLEGFAISGKDGKWYWADASIKDDRIVVSSKNVSNPIAVRYAWAMNPSQANLLYNNEGFPASPFRTDDWPLFKQGVEEVKVNKPMKPQGYTAKDWYRPMMNP